MRICNTKLPSDSGKCKQIRNDREWEAAFTFNAGLDAQRVIQKSSALHRQVFGMRPGNSPHAMDVLNRLLDALKHTPVDARFSDNVKQDIWGKFVFTFSMP